MFVFILQKGKKYSFSYLETSKYLPLTKGELLELTENGAVFRYCNNGDKEKLLESSDIVFQSVLYNQENIYFLNVHKDGSVKYLEENAYEKGR